MPKGIRYTPEQKAKMREEAWLLKAQGKSQKECAERLGVTIPTFKALLDEGGASGMGRRGRPRGGMAISGLSESHPAIQLALKKQRLAEIDQKIAALNGEKERVEEELRTLYKALGEEVFGAEGKRR